MIIFLFADERPANKKAQALRANTSHNLALCDLIRASNDIQSEDNQTAVILSAEG